MLIKHWVSIGTMISFSKLYHRVLVLVLLLVAATFFVQPTLADDEDYDEDGNGFDGLDADDSEIPDSVIALPLRRLSSLDNLNEFLQSTDVLFGGGVIGVFASKDDPDIKEFETLAQPLEGNGFRFAVIEAVPSLLEKYSVKSGWKIFVHPPPNYISETHNDKSRYRFGGTDIKSEAGKNAVKAFALKYYLPLASRISPVAGNERLFVERLLPVFVVISNFDEERDPKGVTYILNRLRKIGENYRDRMIFAIVDKDDAESTLRFQKRYFIEDETRAEEVERIVGIKDGRHYYTMEGTFSVESASAFADDFLAGKLKHSTFQEDIIDIPEEMEPGKIEL